PRAGGRMPVGRDLVRPQPRRPEGLAMTGGAADGEREVVGEPLRRIGRIRPTASGWILLVLASLPLTGVLRSAAIGTPTTAALIIALLTVAAIGVVAPVVRTGRARIALRAPTDATVDEPVELRVRLTGITGDLTFRVHEPTATRSRIRSGT